MERAATARNDGHNRVPRDGIEIVLDPQMTLIDPADPRQIIEVSDRWSLGSHRRAAIGARDRTCNPGRTLPLTFAPAEIQYRFVILAPTDPAYVWILFQGLVKSCRDVCSDRKDPAVRQSFLDCLGESQVTFATRRAGVTKDKIGSPRTDQVQCFTFVHTSSRTIQQFGLKSLSFHHPSRVSQPDRVIQGSRPDHSGAALAP